MQIHNITVIGNKRTKKHIILRELDFQVGDWFALADSAETLKTNRNKIYNTNLFVTAAIQCIAYDNESVDLFIILKERWYIFPLPILELADRNFNEWWHQRNHDLRRLEWGVKFNHDNFRGRNEKLRTVVQFGFTKKFEVFHRVPYINKKKTIGLDYGVSYSTNKSVGYIQENNQLKFHNSENVLRKRFYANASLQYRKQFYTTHSAGITFSHNRIDQELYYLTTFYLGEGLLKQRFFKLNYSFDHNKTNINYYPTKGYAVNINFNQSGLGIFKESNLFDIQGYVRKYSEITPNVFLAHRLTYKVSTPTKQAYIQQQGLGYHEDFVRGFEPFIVDGQHFAVSRNALKFHLRTFTAQLGKWMPIKEFETIPYSLYFKLFTDLGYARNNDKRLDSPYDNELNSGYGFGLDLVTYYDSVMRFEFAINNYGKAGYYFHIEKGI